MNSKLISFFFMLLLFSSNVYADTWKWQSGSNTLYCQERNLEWILSDYELNVLDFNKLPEDMLFCAAINDAMITISLLSFTPEGAEKKQDLWLDGGDDFLNGFMKSIKGQLDTFPGIKYGDIERNNCYYLFKKAIRFSVPLSVSDARLGTDEPIKMTYSGYIFEKDGKLYVPVVLSPVFYVENYGVDVSKSILSTFKYIDASKERN